MIKFQSNGSRKSSPWLPKLKPGAEPALRLFCFPYAGGTANIYANWGTLLPSSIEVCAVELPGRGSRLMEPATTRILQLVETMMPALLPFLDRPFAFFGHSMGALISFELARSLRRTHSLQPAHMFVSACVAPHLRQSRQKVTYNLPEDEFVEELRRLNGTPQEVFEHPELMQLLVPLLRADFEACQTYVYAPEAPLASPLTVFGGLQDKDVERADLEEWREHTSAECILRMVPGDHFFVNHAQATLLRVLAGELMAHIA